ncbi:MAG: lysine exporter LysO family protein [Acidobacteria bacterium]|nr:lysine exporter LysO family protein [Acidobacteriota bacterium]
MKGSLTILSFFLGGLILSLFGLVPGKLLDQDLTMYILYVLLFFVGAMVGSDRETWHKIRQLDFRIVLAPLTVIFGTLGAIAVFSFLIPGINMRDSLAIGAGFGYYSLSSVIITNLRGETLGVIALAVNITREILTLTLTPLIAKYFGNLAPVVSGGATAMDTTLPIITKYSGKEYAAYAIFSGFILTILVPILVTFILKI